MRRIAPPAAICAALTLLLPGTAVAAADWSWPVRGDVVTKYRNGGDPYAAGQHRGIDIAAAVGTQVVAATAGRVEFAGTAGSSGLTVTLRTADGRFDLSHLHLSSVAVRAGDAVRPGDRLGAVGVSGRRSVGQPHLHFGVREAGSDHGYRDPLDFLPPLPRPAAQPEPPAAPPSPAPVGAPPALAPAPRAPAAVPTVGEPVVAPAPVPSPAPAGLPIGAAAGAAVAQPVAPLADDPIARADAPPAAASVSAVAPAPAARVQPATRRGGVSAAHGRLAAVHDLGSAPTSAREPAAASAPDLRPPRPVPADRGARGFDAGWLAALIGLVTAAACLGRPEGARRAARTGHAAVRGALRPLFGGR